MGRRKNSYRRAVGDFIELFVSVRSSWDLIGNHLAAVKSRFGGGRRGCSCSGNRPFPKAFNQFASLFPNAYVKTESPFASKVRAGRFPPSQRSLRAVLRHESFEAPKKIGKDLVHNEVAYRRAGSRLGYLEGRMPFNERDISIRHGPQPEGGDDVCVIVRLNCIGPGVLEVGQGDEALDQVPAVILLLMQPHLPDTSDLVAARNTLQLQFRAARLERCRGTEVAQVGPHLFYRCIDDRTGVCNGHFNLHSAMTNCR